MGCFGVLCCFIKSFERSSRTMDLYPFFPLSTIYAWGWWSRSDGINKSDNKNREGDTHVTAGLLFRFMRSSCILSVQSSAESKKIVEKEDVQDDDDEDEDSLHRANCNGVTKSTLPSIPCIPHHPRLDIVFQTHRLRTGLLGVCAPFLNATTLDMYNTYNNMEFISLLSYQC